MCLKAAQLAASFSAVPLKALVSADTKQPLLVIYVLESSDSIGVSCGEEFVRSGYPSTQPTKIRALWVQSIEIL